MQLKPNLIFSKQVVQGCGAKIRLRNPSESIGCGGVSAATKDCGVSANYRGVNAPSF